MSVHHDAHRLSYKRSGTNKSVIQEVAVPTFGYMPFMPTRRLLEEIADSAARQALASTMAHLARHYRGGRPSVLEKQWRQDDEDIRRYLSNSGRFRSVSKVS